MLSVRIIPCLDVRDGRVVKGVNFVNLVDTTYLISISLSIERLFINEKTYSKIIK